MTAAVRKVLSENPKEFDPRKYLGPARAKVKAFLDEWEGIDQRVTSELWRLLGDDCREYLDEVRKGLAIAPSAHLDYLQYPCVADGERARSELGFIPRQSTRDCMTGFARTRLRDAA